MTELHNHRPSSLWSSTTRLRRVPQILDCTLRDGSYVSDFHVTTTVATMVMTLLGTSSCDYVEIGHGLGIGAARALSHELPLSDTDWYQLARDLLPGKDVGCFVLPGLARLDDLKRAACGGMKFVRVGVEIDEWSASRSLVEKARSLGLKVFVNMLKCERGNAADVVAVAAALHHELEPDGIYFVDSLGCLLPAHVRDIFSRAADHLDTELGFHGHNNLQLAVANSIAARDAGADIIDVTIGGLGRGAGNTPAEVFAAVLAAESEGQTQAFHWLHLCSAAERVLEAFANYKRYPAEQLLACAVGELHTSRVPEILCVAEEMNLNPALLMARPGLLDSPDVLADLVPTPLLPGHGGRP